MNRSKIIQNKIKSFLIIIVILSQVTYNTSMLFGEENKLEVSGTVYEFEEGAHYEFMKQQSASAMQTIGSVSIQGDVELISEKNGLSKYVANSGTVKFSYTYTSNQLSNIEDDWIITEDKTNLLNDVSLPQTIENGALVLQTSKDGELWITTKIQTDLFDEHTNGMDSFYETKEIQQTNGTYYRIIVAYQLGRKIGQKKVGFIPLPWDEYEYKKYAEVYTFFIQNESESSFEGEQISKFKLGEVVNTGVDNGFSQINEIFPSDPHYGWEIGNFFVSGYTHVTTNQNGTPVFLKNVGDKVTLWYNLKENIDRLNGNEALSVAEDSNGFDQQFQTAKTNLGRGGLYIRYTDFENITHAPVLFTNFLEANASVDADTKVQVFEEGDYEIALDYELKNDKTKLFGQSVLPEFHNYRIFARFSIRNGNSMVYLFDSETHSELTNSSTTPNGFYLDLAKSRYLDINIRKEVMNSSADGLVEDTRFNKPAKDGDQYNEEGVYTITVSNRYTGQTTVKKIYVGSDKVLLATINTGRPITEIKKLIQNGAEITESGLLVQREDTSEEEIIQPTVKNKDNLMLNAGKLLLILILGGGTALIAKNIVGIFVKWMKQEKGEEK